MQIQGPEIFVPGIQIFNKIEINFLGDPNILKYLKWQELKIGVHFLCESLLCCLPVSSVFSCLPEYLTG